MRTLLITLLLLASNLRFASGQQYQVNSPDGNIQIDITAGPDIAFSVNYRNEAILNPSGISISIDKTTPDVWKVRRIRRRTVEQDIHPVIREKSKTIRDHFNEITIEFRNHILLTFRAYNNGVAYRWETQMPDSIEILDETVHFAFHQNDSSLYPLESSFYSHNERLYKHFAIHEISRDSLASLPVLVTHDGIKMLISEADLYNYPGMWLTGNSGTGLTATFPPYPAEERLVRDRDRRVIRTENFIAYTEGNRTFPWRVIMIERNDAGLLVNQLVYQLSRETEEDFSWVRPGKVSWDWWNALNLYQVDFRSGINTETYKYYIDFAARYGLEYIILDEGWSPTTDITVCIEDINMPELLSYAAEKNVGMILWVLWTSLDNQMEAALDLYQRWGIKGIKVDFMQRDDQVAVNFYERTAREAAERKLIVDFHGSFKPTGMERMYPNVLTREGVYGLEQSKWDNTRSIAPEHNVTLPFIRNAVGPMDYTPGAMLNAQSRSWAPFNSRPMSLGTRCHQLAMYIVFTSPLQMLCDAPSNYYREPECMEFLSIVPVVWDQSVALEGKAGDYVVVARKALSGDWYVGAMTDWTARDLQIDFWFLEEGDFRMDIWQDGVNADRVAVDYSRYTEIVNNDMKKTIDLAPGGGWVARIYRFP
ncbi:MAG: glycoside hydrolase family 97 protein [Bacteroidales bacterium]|nr:glycoside hydrolase family 97 protein [Bacteroidales bacterium]